MRVIVAQALSVLMEVMLFGSAVARGLAADLRMLSLVPPESQIVAGVVAAERARHQGRFILSNVANRIDYEDFLSLAAGDPLLEIDELIFTAAAGPSGVEHSVIVSGRLQRDRIYRSAGYPASAQDYRGMVVLLVRPFDRERAYFQQDRLLAIISPNLAIFGTLSSVRKEIDRFLDGNAADSLIVQRVSLLNSEDDSWYLVRSLVRRAEFVGVLTRLDPALSEIDTAEELLFGIRYRKQVEIEYVTNAVPNPERDLHLNAPARKMFRDESDQLRPAVCVVKVARRRFGEWVKQITGQ